MSRIATLLLLSSLFITCALAQRIIGGERSIWAIGDTDGYDSGVTVEDAYLYDPRLNSWGNSAIYNAYYTRMRVFDSYYNYYSGYYIFAPSDPRASGSFVAEDYQFENLNITKQFYVSPTLPTVRSYFTMTAINEPIQLEISFFANIPSDGYSFPLFGEFNNNGLLDKGDEWYVTGLPYIDQAQRQINTPFVTWSVFGPGATNTPIDTSFGNYFYYYYNSNGANAIRNTFVLDLQPGIPQSLLFFAELSLTSGEAIAAASKYEIISELRKTDLLFGLTDDDFKQISNWGLQNPRKVTSYTGICDFADEIKDRVSKLRSNERHSFNQPWRC